MDSSIRNASGVAGSGLNDVLTSLMVGGNNNIGSVYIKGNLQTALTAASGATDGNLHLQDAQTGAAAINVGDVRVVLNENATNSFSGAIVAGEIDFDALGTGSVVFNNSVTLSSISLSAYQAKAATTFKGAVNANVFASGASVTFSDGSSLNGSLGTTSDANSKIFLGTSPTDTVDITIANGQRLSIGNNITDAVSVTTGSSLTFASGSSFTGTGNGQVAVAGTVSYDTGMATNSLSKAVSQTVLGAAGVANINGSADNAEALAFAATSAGAVNVNTAATLNSLDVKNATLAIKNNTTFTGALNTDNTTSSALSIDAGKTVTFGGNVGVGAGGGFVFGNGSTGVFTGGTSVGGVITASGATFSTKGAGSVAIGDSLDASGGGTLYFGDDGANGLTAITGGANSVVIDGSTKLGINSGNFNGAAQTLVADNVLDYTAIGAINDLDAYLDGQSTHTINHNITYSKVNGTGGIQVALTQIAGSVKDRLTNVASRLGYGDLAPGASGSYAQAVADAAGNAGSGSLATNATGERTGQILGSLGGVDWTVSPITGKTPFAFSGGSREARAAYQGTTGKFLANTLYVSIDTVARGIDHINSSLSRLSPAETPAYGQAAISSERGLASYAVNCGGSVNRFWFGGFGMWDDADQRKNDAGYKYESGGAMLGFDRTFSGAVTVGGAFGYTAGKYKDKAVLSNNSDIDTYSFNLYAEYKHRSGFFGRVIGAYAYSDDDIDVLYTAVDRDKADYHVNTWSVGGSVGYEWRPISRLAVTPSVGLYYYNARSNKFDSTIRDDLRLKYHRTEMPVDLEIAYTAVECGDSRLTVKANGGWAYNFNKDSAHGDFVYNGLGVGSVYVEGRKTGRHTLKAGGGISYEYKQLEFSADYTYRHRSKMDSHAVFGSVGIRF